MFKGKINVVVAGEGTYNKHAKGEASFSKYREYAKAISKKLSKEGKEHMVTVINGEGKQALQIRSKLFAEK